MAAFRNGDTASNFLNTSLGQANASSRVLARHPFPRPGTVLRQRHILMEAQMAIHVGIDGFHRLKTSASYSCGETESLSTDPSFPLTAFLYPFPLLNSSFQE